MSVPTARFPLTTANKSGGVVLFSTALSPYVVDSNSFWSPPNVWISRYNPGFVRLTAWDTALQFETLITPDATNDDVSYAVVQNGALFATVTGTPNGLPQLQTVGGLTVGATIELWETRQGIQSSNTNSNANRDSQHQSGYISAVYVPQPYSVPTTAAVNAPQAAAVNAPPPNPLPKVTTATVAIAWLGMSIPQYTTDVNPSCWFSALGQARQLAHQQGKLILDFTYGGGTFNGDGFTPAQRAQDVFRGYQAAGSPATFFCYFDDIRNDWNYADLNGFGVHPAQGESNLVAFATALTARIPQTQYIFNTTISQVNEGANLLGDTLPQWRVNCVQAAAATVGAALVDGPALGITQPTYLGPDGVHMTEAGATRYDNGAGVPSNSPLHLMGLM